MDYLQEIAQYCPDNVQEEQDQRIILSYAEQFRENVLERTNEIAHITSSGFIMNPECDKVLFIHHTLRNTWAWTGGHADGDPDLLHVALKEAMEETGVGNIRPLIPQIVSLDILTMPAHLRRGCYVNAHLHLSAAYLLVCSEDESLTVCEGENTAVAWFPADIFKPGLFNAWDVYLYRKLVEKAKRLKRLCVQT